MHPRELTPSDYIELEQLMALYVYIRDDNDMDRLDGLFTADGVFDLTGFGGDQIATGIPGISELCMSLPHPRAIHFTTNMIASEGEGPAINLRSRYFAPYADGRSAVGEYRDEAVRTDVGWRLRRRAAIPWRGEQ